MFLFTFGTAGLRNIFPLKFLTALMFLIVINSLTRHALILQLSTNLFLRDKNYVDITDVADLIKFCICWMCISTYKSVTMQI